MSYQDVNENPQDNKLTVQFYRNLWQNHTKTIEEGRPIFEERDFVKIAVPGNTTLLIDTLAEEHHIVRFPQHYKRYKEAMGNAEVVNGTPLSQWPVITRTTAEKLRYIKFETVEQIAGADDYQLNAIGMNAGMSPNELKRLAKAYLESSKGTAEAAKRTAELDLLRSDNEDLRTKAISQDEQIRDLQRQIAQLAAAQLGSQETATKKRKKQEESTEE